MIDEGVDVVKLMVDEAPSRELAVVVGHSCAITAPFFLRKTRHGAFKE